MAGLNPKPTLSDAELALAARAGDASALGVLLERYRPRLFAMALHLLGYRPDAEDAVQDTYFIAIRHIGAVRDPNAVGSWLHAVLRRTCLQRRRRGTGLLFPETLPEIVDDGATPEDRLERLELRDWIREALQRLPEPLRVTAMLRYFGSYDSYEEVAAILGVPVGTVRSRLSEAKRKLGEALLASAGLIDDERRARVRDRARFWADVLDDIFRRGDADGFVSQFPPDLLLAWSGRTVLQGRTHLAEEIEGDLAAGVRLYPERVMSSDGVAVIEGRFVNPPDNPHHCPPGIALVLFGAGEQPTRMHLHLAPRPPRAADDE